MGQVAAAGKPAVLDLPAGTYAKTGSKFVSACNVNGKVVSMPHSGETILVVDVAAGKASAIDLPGGITRATLDKFWCACNVNGKAVAAPGAAEKILVVEPESGGASAIDLPAGIGAEASSKFRSVCNVNGKAVAAPFNAEKVLVVDPETGRASAIDLPAGIGAGTPGKFVSDCNVNGKAVAVPFNAEKILVVDPANGRASAIDLPAGINAGTPGKYMFVCDVNGKAVAVPCNAEKILVVDPSKGEASAIDIPTGIDARRDSKFCCACFVNGKAVAVPFNAEKILVVDPAAGQASTIDLPKILDTQTSAKFCSVCKVNGKATAVPQDSTRILVVDPSTGEASAIDLPAGIDSRKVSKFGSVCNVNGKAVAVPQEAEKILLVDVAGSGERTRSLDLTLHNTEVPWKAEFAEMVAAVLSYWIYTDDPKPPHLQHAAMTVHRVTQPGEFGSAVKIATVTAELPSEKVLYVVFKGTSYILDFLNWNLELDHATTEDTDFFIHGGAAGTLRGAQFWKERDFLERLASAKAQGVQKIVFTGHSLGGMYAAALLYVAWKKITGGPSDGQQLLKSFDVRCVTFGSPMVFGGGSQGSKQAKSFQEFAQERAANYIHANDPCPRAWGALDLRQFVEAAARNVQNGLVDELGCIKGQVVSKVVEEAARQVLQRPDFNLLEDFGRKYQHFIPLKVLTGTKQFVNWKEFQLTPDCLKDHSVQSYVNRLFDAFDDCRPDCHVHSQLP